MLGFREICSVTAALPIVTLMICFVSAVVFQFDDVHETHCRVLSKIEYEQIYNISKGFLSHSIGMELHTVDKRHNRYQSEHLLLANKYCIACRTKIYNCHLL